MARKSKFWAGLFSLCVSSSALAQEASGPWDFQEIASKFDRSKTVAIVAKSTYGLSDSRGEIAARLAVRCQDGQIGALVMFGTPIMIGSFQTRMRVDDKPPAPIAKGSSSPDSRSAVWLATAESKPIVEAMNGAKELAFRFEGRNVDRIDVIFDVSGFDQAAAPVRAACAAR